MEIEPPTSDVGWVKRSNPCGPTHTATQPFLKFLQQLIQRINQGQIHAAKVRTESNIQVLHRHNKPLNRALGMRLVVIKQNRKAFFKIGLDLTAQQHQLQQEARGIDRAQIRQHIDEDKVIRLVWALDN